MFREFLHLGWKKEERGQTEGKTKEAHTDSWKGDLSQDLLLSLYGFTLPLWFCTRATVVKIIPCLVLVLLVMILIVVM